jgi:hypothetical protein
MRSDIECMFFPATKRRFMTLYRRSSGFPFLETLWHLSLDEHFTVDSSGFRNNLYPRNQTPRPEQFGTEEDFLSEFFTDLLSVLVPPISHEDPGTILV